MSFRPLTISAPLYRAYATMRLKDMQPWVNQWMTTEMYAGVPGSGATDAWYKVLLDIEQMKVEEQPFCGAAADILKFFDQIVREVVYKMASLAGMPKKVLSAYKRYVEGLKVYNCLAGGVGTPYVRKCGIPQGCPFSMMLVALLMRPWILIMLAAAMKATLLADDVLMVSTGSRMVGKLAQALKADT